MSYLASSKAVKGQELVARFLLASRLTCPRSKRLIQPEEEVLNGQQAVSYIGIDRLQAGNLHHSIGAMPLDGLEHPSFFPGSKRLADEKLDLMFAGNPLAF